MGTVPTVQAKVERNGATFEICAYRPLSEQEIDREIAFYIVERQPLKRGKTYRVFSSLGEPAKKGG